LETKRIKSIMGVTAKNRSGRASAWPHKNSMFKIKSQESGKGPRGKKGKKKEKKEGRGKKRCKRAKYQKATQPRGGGEKGKSSRQATGQVGAAVPGSCQSKGSKREQSKKKNTDQDRRT